MVSKYKQKLKPSLPTKFRPRFWVETDRRSSLAQAIRRTLKRLKADAGVDCIQKELIAERAVFLTLQLQTMEVQAAEGEDINVGAYATLTNSLLGCLRSLGLEKKEAANVLDLDAYKQKYDRKHA